MLQKYKLLFLLKNGTCDCHLLLHNLCKQDYAQWSMLDDTTIVMDPILDSLSETATKQLTFQKFFIYKKKKD